MENGTLRRSDVRHSADDADNGMMMYAASHTPRQRRDGRHPMKRYMVWVSLAVGSSSLTSCNGNSAPAPAVQSPAAVKPVAAGTAPATATTVKPVATDKTAANR